MDKRIFGGDFYRVDWNGYCKFINKLNPMTNKYKVGMALVDEEGFKYKVFGVCDDVVFYGAHEECDGMCLMGTYRNMDTLFTIEKEDWRPVMGEKYYYADDCGSIASDVFDESFDYDMFRLATKNCFKTKAEAEQRLSEIKKEYGIK